MSAKSLASVALAALIVAAGARAAEATRYLIFTGDGKPAGEQVVERADDGITRVRFVFKTNGRGPELMEVFRLTPDGTLAEYAVTGSAEMGGPVDERFLHSGGKVTWHTTSDSGSATVSGPALYVPLNGSFEIASISIAAVAARADGRLPLLPTGSLSQRRLDEVELTQGGQTRRVQLLAQTGIGFTPAFYWATLEAKPRLFAVVQPGWMTLVESGWESHSELLATRQRSAANALLKEMATQLRHPLPGLTVVRNARVFDSESARLSHLSDVYVLRGRISAVVPAGTLRRTADHAIDAAGRVMLPGLFDMHTHMDRWDGGLHLAAGVTTVRDMGNDNAKMQQMLDEQAAGQLLAPQIVPCGFLEGDSPHASRWGFVIKTLQEAKDAVDWYVARGYPQLKIYNSFPREMVRDIVAYAHERGMRVSGHVPAFMRAAEVVEQGFDEVQHINQVLLNFLVTPSTDTRTLDRFYLPAQQVAGLDFDSRPVADFIDLLKQHHTVIDPTLATFDFIKQREGELSAPYAAVAAHLPPDVQRGMRTGGLKIPDDATDARYKASYAKMIEFVGRLHRAGLALVAGTDGLPGFTLHSELELYVKAGLTPSQVLQIATRDAARLTLTGAERGSVTPGKLADLVLVDGDPTKDIGDVRKIVLVITQGQLILPAEVHRALGVAPFVQDAPLLSAVDGRQ